MEATLQELKQYQGSPTVSIYVSTQVESFEGKKQLTVKLKNALKEAANELKRACDEETARKLLNSARSLTQNIDLNHLENGVGIYVAPGFATSISFPFAVPDRVVVASSFDVSDLQRTFEEMPQFSVLLLSKQVARLFQGKGNRLEEIADEHFPFYFEDQFQVHRTSPHSFYNNEESDIDQARLKNYYRKVDKLLYPRIKGKPLMLMGTVKALSDFRSVIKNDYEVIAELLGNFDKFKVHEVAQLVMPEVKKYREVDFVSK